MNIQTLKESRRERRNSDPRYKVRTNVPTINTHPPWVVEGVCSVNIPETLRRESGLTELDDKDTGPPTSALKDTLMLESPL